MNPSIALIGCGNWGRHILRDLTKLGCEVHVVARSPASIERARTGGARSVVPSADSLPEVDGVIVATPTATHAEVVEELVELGVPLFVEKPLTNDARDARKLAEIEPDRIFVMDKWRYHPGVELLAKIGRSKELGEVLGLSTVRVGWGHPHDDVDPIWMLAPHDLSISLEILGKLADPVSAVAERFNHETVGLFAILGEDPWHTIDLSVARSNRVREVRLICERGVAVLPDSYSTEVLVWEAYDLKESHQEPERRPLSREMPLLRELQAFIGFLQGGPPPRSTAKEGAAVVEVIASLRELARI